MGLQIEIQAFLAETTTKTATGSVGATALYGRYLEWSSRHGLPGGSQTAFGRQLNALGYQWVKRTRAKHRYWLGLSFLAATPVETVGQVETVQMTKFPYFHGIAVEPVETVGQVETVATVETVEEELAAILANVTAMSRPRVEAERFLASHCVIEGDQPRASLVDLYAAYVAQGGTLSHDMLVAAIGSLGHCHTAQEWLRIGLRDDVELDGLWSSKPSALEFMDTV